MFIQSSKKLFIAVSFFLIHSSSFSMQKSWGSSIKNFVTQHAKLCMGGALTMFGLGYIACNPELGAKIIQKAAQSVEDNPEVASALGGAVVVSGVWNFYYAQRIKKCGKVIDGLQKNVYDLHDERDQAVKDASRLVSIIRSAQNGSTVIDHVNEELKKKPLTTGWMNDCYKGNIPIFVSVPKDLFGEA